MHTHPCQLCGRAVADAGAAFCCPGCAAIHQIVVRMGLSGAARDERIQALLQGIFPRGLKADPIDFVSPETDAEDAAGCGPADQDLHLHLGGMVCPACAWLIHNTLAAEPGVAAVNINFLAETCTLRYDPMRVGPDALRSHIDRLGYRALDSEADNPGADPLRFGAGWFFAVNAMMLAAVVYVADWIAIPRAMRIVCSLLLLVFGTLTPLVATPHLLITGWQQIRRRHLRMESLIVISCTAAWLMSLVSLLRGDFARLYFEVVALLLMLIETGNRITGGFYRRLKRRIHALREALPKKVRLDAEGRDFRPLDDLQPGDSFHVTRGEPVPTDGVLLDEASFDFSLISGESAAVTLEPGRTVGAGARLLSDRARLAVPPAGRSSLIETIIESTIAAFDTKQDPDRLGDRISAIFVPAVLILAAAVLILTAIARGPEAALLRALSVLIVACPCAFGIAEPLVLTAAIDWARRCGIQVFNGRILGLRPDTICFDKTGTLTEGRLQVARIHWQVPEDPALLDALASLEAGIEHPIARSLAALGRPRPLAERRIERDRVWAVVGGQAFQAGSPRLYPDWPLAEDLAAATVVLFGTERDCLAVIELADRIRPEAPDLIRALRTQGLQVALCSGDRPGVVARIAGDLGITEAHADMSPAAKTRYLAERQAEGRSVLMVGDGINDAQALAQADLGLAVFNGQLPAKMSSDGAFLTHELTGLVAFLRLLRSVRRRIRFNYAWSFLYNVVGLGLAGAGLLSPTFCAFGMVFSNLVVLLNSLRGRGPRPQAPT